MTTKIRTHEQLRDFLAKVPREKLEAAAFEAICALYETPDLDAAGNTVVKLDPDLEWEVETVEWCCNALVDILEIEIVDGPETLAEQPTAPGVDPLGDMTNRGSLGHPTP